MSDAKTTWRALTTTSDNRDAALALMKQARRDVAIFTHDFDPQIYGTPEFVEAAKNFVLSGGKTSLRILLMDSNRARKEGHRLVELGRRLSSFIEIRKPHKDYQDLVENFMTVDETALLLRKLASRWEGIADTHDPVQAREKLKLFNEIWQRSQEEPEARRLGI